jgi:hypothetical protein
VSTDAAFNALVQSAFASAGGNAAGRSRDDVGSAAPSAANVNRDAAVAAHVSPEIVSCATPQSVAFGDDPKTMQRSVNDGVVIDAAEGVTQFTAHATPPIVAERFSGNAGPSAGAARSKCVVPETENANEGVATSDAAVSATF